MESHFSKITFCTLQPISFPDSSSPSPTWLKHMYFPGYSVLGSFQWLLMPCQLNIKLSNMAHQLHTLQLVLYTTWPVELALLLCAAPPSGTLTALWKSHSCFRTSSIGSSGKPCGSPLQLAVPCLEFPKCLQGTFILAFIILNARAGFFLPLATSALSCLFWLCLSVKHVAWPLLGSVNFSGKIESVSP